MATNSSTSIQGKTVCVQSCGLMHNFTTFSVLSVKSLDGNVTGYLGAVVPADGAELIDMFWAQTLAATITTSAAWNVTVSDGTNVLAHTNGSNQNVTGTAGAVFQLTMGTATNGKAIATAKGARLTITNTETGTIAQTEGMWTLVWAL